MVVADEPLKRSECNGWRFSGGILFFGGRHDDGATSNNAVLLDNDFTNQGELKANRWKNFKLSFRTCIFHT